MCPVVVSTTVGFERIRLVLSKVVATTQFCKYRTHFASRDAHEVVEWRFKVRSAESIQVPKLWFDATHAQSK